MEKKIKIYKLIYKGDVVTGTSKTLVPFIPLNDKVILRSVFEEGIMIVRDENSLAEASPKHTIVVGVGNDVHTVEIGDEVQVARNSNIERIFIDNNDKSIRNMHELLKDYKYNPITDKDKKAIMIEYYLVSAFQIVGIRI
jgi:hypothetical protein